MLKEIPRGQFLTLGNVNSFATIDLHVLRKEADCWRSDLEKINK
jgi:hypothetical protein